MLKRPNRGLGSARIAIIAGLALAATVPGCGGENGAPVGTIGDGTFYQVSTLDALSRGAFDGRATLGAVEQHGDFGLGTFDALDGEMVGIGGQFYQVRDDGHPVLVTPSETTPFAVVTQFAPNQTVQVPAGLNFAGLQSYLDSVLPSLNVPYAIKLTGLFATVKARSEHRQTRPYPTLTQALANQVIFPLTNVTGTAAGFRTPAYMSGVNVVGYHFHFLSADRLLGGHVLDLTTSSVAAEIEPLPDVQISLSSLTSPAGRALLRSRAALAPGTNDAP